MTLIEDPTPVTDDELVPGSIFRAYDIRGIVDEQLDGDSVQMIARAIASEALAQNITTLLLAYDGRLSSPQLSKALIAGILSTGCNLINLGQVPTPLLYFATHRSQWNSGVMLTASHNPANYNGIKIVFNRASLEAEQIQSIRARIESNDLVAGSGKYAEYDITTAYRERISSSVKLSRKLKVVVDCANAVAGKIAPQLYSDLGCEVIPLFCELDGRFPNHHPDPTIAANLDSLCKKVKQTNADIGLAFDGDADRLGVVTNCGEIINADRVLMLLTQSIAASYQGAAIVFDVKCSKKLPELIRELGCVPIMHKSGHSFMKQKMVETGAPLGGEFAAHIFIKDRWFGFDDGLYAGARLLEVLSRSSLSSNELFAALPDCLNTPEIALPVPEQSKFALMQRVVELASFPDATVITIDGLRVEFADGWGLIRASNTTPAILLRFEAESEYALTSIQAKFKALIKRADKSIECNF